MNRSKSAQSLTRHARSFAGIGVIAAVLLLPISAQASITFTFDYANNPAGVGFLDPAAGAARQNALATAASLFSNLFGQSFGNTATIDLAVTSTNDASTPIVATAATDFIPAPGTFGGGEVIRNKLLSNGATDLNGAAADGSLSVNFAKSFQLDPNTAASSTQFDFYSTLFHELTHALGFGSEISGIAGSDRFSQGTQGSGSPGSFAKWDQFLTDAAGTPLVDPTTFEVDSAAYRAAQTTGARFAGANAVGAYGNPVPIYPNPDLSHLDETAFATPTVPDTYLMTPYREFGASGSRNWQPTEIAILADLGYTPLPGETDVPEPASALLLLAGTAAMIVARRKA